MQTDDDDLALLRREKAAPSDAHDHAVLAAIDAASKRIAGRKRERRRFPTWRIALPFAVAASVLLVPFWLGQQPDTLRNGTTVADVWPANASELEKAPDRIQWPPQATADEYVVTLRDNEGVIILEARTAQPVNSISLSEDDLAKLRPGTSYFWTVRVGDSEQGQIGPYWFNIKADRRPEPE